MLCSAPVNPDKPDQEDDQLNSFLLNEQTDMADALLQAWAMPSA